MSEHYANNIDVSEQVRDVQVVCEDLRSLVVRVWGLVAIVFGVFVFVWGGLDEGGDKYLPSTKAGMVRPVISYSDVYLDYDERVALAKRIVQTLNSLSFRDKDEMLSSVEQYFTPKVFKGYILGQYNRAFFEQMTTFEVSYIAEITPANDVNGTMYPVVYAHDICYEADVMGDSLKAGVDCRYTRAVNRQSETYFFNIERLVVVKGEAKQMQEFKVRLVLTRVDGALYDKGYLVSEYTEI